MRSRVIRDRPTPRDRLQGLTGILRYRIEVIRPVHVGGRGMRLEKPPSLELPDDVDEAVRVLERIATRVGRDFKEFFSTSGVPTIPGSSLKGAVRSRLELTFRSHNGQVPSCFIVSSKGTYVARKGGKGWRHQLVYPSSREDRGAPCNYLKFGTVCKVCDIFGSPGLGSRVEFSSVTFDCEMDYIEYRGEPIEVLPQGCSSTGLVNFLNMRPYELGLLIIGMGAGEPLLLGFGKYRGMGRVKMTPEEWLFLRTSKKNLEKLGIEFTEYGNMIRISDAESFWNYCLSEARQRYGQYLGVVKLDGD